MHGLPTSANARALQAALGDFGVVLLGSPTRHTFEATPFTAAQTQLSGQLSLVLQVFVQNACCWVPMHCAAEHSEGSMQDAPRSVYDVPSRQPLLGPPEVEPPDEVPPDVEPLDEDPPEEDDPPLFQPPVALPVHVAPNAPHARGQLSAADAQWLLLQLRAFTGLPSEQSQNQLGQSSAFWQEGPSGSFGLVLELEPEDPEEPDELPPSLSSPPEPVLLPPEQATRPNAIESVKEATARRMRSSP